MISQQGHRAATWIIDAVRCIELCIDAIPAFFVPQIDIRTAVAVKQIQRFIFCGHGNAVFEMQRNIVGLRIGVNDIQVLDSRLKRLS